MSDPTLGAKIASMLVLGLGSFAMGVAPLKLAKWLRIRRPGVPTSCGYPHADATGAPPLMSLLLYFGGGVLLYAASLHLQPEVRERADRLQAAGWLPFGAGVQHLGDLLVFACFLTVFAADELVHAAVDRYAATRRAAAGGDRVALHRSASMRRRPVCAPRVPGDEDVGAVEAIIASTIRPGQSSYRPAATAAAMAEERRLRRLERERRAADEAEKMAEGLVQGTGRHSARGLLAVAALTFPELFAGLAIGVEARADRVWYLCAAVATHKFVVASSTGLEMTWCCNVRRSAIIAYAAAFSVAAPLGVAFGTALSRCGVVAGVAADGTSGCAAVFVQALAAGTFLYVVFFEVLARHKQTGIWCPLCIVVGFAVMMALHVTIRQDYIPFVASRTNLKN